jgi:hypothetical protein
VLQKIFSGYRLSSGVNIPTTLGNMLHYRHITDLNGGLLRKSLIITYQAKKRAFFRCKKLNEFSHAFIECKGNMGSNMRNVSFNIETLYFALPRSFPAYIPLQICVKSTFQIVSGENQDTCLRKEIRMRLL